MTKVMILRDIDKFNLKEGEIYEIKLDYDFKGYIHIGKRRCYIENRIQRGEIKFL